MGIFNFLPFPPPIALYFQNYLTIILTITLFILLKTINSYFVNMTVKHRCKKCGNFRPITDFFKGETCIDGYFKICKNCRRKELETYIL